MRIAYLVNQYPSVSHTFIRREIRALEGQGHEIHRFSIRDMAGQFIDPADDEEWKKTHSLLNAGACAAALVTASVRHPIRAIQTLKMALQLSRSSHRGLLRHVAYFLEACHLVRELRQRGVEHLHAHFGTNSASVALLTHVLSGVPYSFTVHGPEEFDRPLAESLPAKIAHAAFVVAISSFGKSQLERWCAADQCAKIHVVRCGLASDYVDVPPTPVPETNRLVCVARLSEQKGLFVLVEAAQQIRGHVDFELVIVGDGPLRQSLEARITELGLNGKVKLTGAQTGAQVRDWLNSARAFVLPSFAEGLPVVIMEALASGRPVISTYVAGIPELITDGENGWLVPAGDVDRLTTAIREALEKPPAEMFEMGLCGRERVRAMHSVDQEAKKLAALFSSTGD